MLSLSRELAGRGHEVFLLHEEEGSMLADYAAFSAGLLQTRLPGFAMRAPLRTLAGIVKLGNLARGLGIDVVLSSHRGYIRHAALVRLLHGIPSCFHLGLPSIGSGKTLRMAYPNVGAGISPSAHTLATWAAGGWPAASLHVVRNWVDPSRFKPVADVGALRRELDLPAGVPCVVFVGRVCAQKGIDVLLRAFAKLDARADEACLVIVGAIAPDYQQQFDVRLDSLGEQVRRRIILRPVTPTPEKYYAAADVVCAPSLGDEAFGLTVLEAMSCGVPVISSAIGIIASIVGEQDGDLLVEAGDADELAKRLHSWLARPGDRNECGRRLRERVLQHYGPDASIDAYETVIAGLACTRRPCRA